MNSGISSTFVPVTNRSSTYTATTTKCSFDRFWYNEGSLEHLTKLKRSSTLLSFAFHALRACLKPYRALFNLYTLSSLPLTLKPYGWLTYTSSFRSPCKNAILTSKWCFPNHEKLPKLLWNEQFRFSPLEQIFSQSLCRVFVCIFFATSLDLYLFMLSSLFLLILNIYFKPITFAPFGKSTRSHVLFLIIDFISSSHTHLSTLSL